MNEDNYWLQINECSKKAGDLLIGKTIVDIKYPDKDIMDKYNWWRQAPLVIVLDNGTKLIPQIDDSGTDGGTFIIINDMHDELEIFPCLS